MRQDQLFQLLGLCALGLSLRAPVAAQGIVQGRVLRAPSRKPIPNVEVTATNERVPNGLKTRSNLLGYYTIAGVPTGPTVLTFRARGFEKFSQSVEVVKETTTFNTWLEPGVGWWKFSIGPNREARGLGGIEGDGVGRQVKAKE
jgi:hypothetical protein